MGKAGPAKVQKYTKLAGRFMDALSTDLGRLGSLDVGAPQPSAPATDIPAQIKKLAELRDAGALTPEEFETKKTELLTETGLTAIVIEAESLDPAMRAALGTQPPTS